MAFRERRCGNFRNQSRNRCNTRAIATSVLFTIGKLKLHEPNSFCSTSKWTTWGGNEGKLGKYAVMVIPEIYSEEPQDIPHIVKLNVNGKTSFVW